MPEDFAELSFATVQFSEISDLLHNKRVCTYVYIHSFWMYLQIYIYAKQQKGARVCIPAGFLVFKYFGCLKIQSLGSFLTELHAAVSPKKNPG